MSRYVRFDGLWRHPDFLKLWAGHTVSLAGSLVGRFALPLVAILTLDASPGEVALLRMADHLPGVVIGLVAGVWVDRLRRRPLMIWTDVGRALLLLSIPLAAVLGLLTLDPACGGRDRGRHPDRPVRGRVAVVPAVGDRARGAGRGEQQAPGEQLGRRGRGVRVRRAAGPDADRPDRDPDRRGLVRRLGASAWAASASRSRPSARPQDGHTTWMAIREGLRLVVHDPILRALAGAKATNELFLHIWVSMLLVFLTRDLEMDPVVFGVLFAVGGVCSFFGAVAGGARRAAARTRADADPQLLHHLGDGAAGPARDRSVPAGGPAGRRAAACGLPRR